jgi:3-oxoacyl-[acyl-carrier protein] reductase
MNHSPVVLVVGGSRGLGAACVTEFMAQGARVHATWRTPGANATALQARLGACAHPCDLSISDPAASSSIATTVARVVKQEGRLDVLAIAAGDYLAGSLESHSADLIATQLQQQVVGPARAMSAARAALRHSQGCAVLFGVAGLDGLRGRKRSAAYCAAKSALLVLVRSWALEEALHGVRVNMVSPGVVPHLHADPETLAPETLARVPLPGATTPEDLARAVRWLCSAEARHVTGADLPVAGGFAL